MYGLTPRQQDELTAEAERRVRAGESQAEVAKALGIPRSTLADWARRGGWRRKDLVAVRNAEHGQMVLGLIRRLTDKEHEQQRETAARLRAALEASKAEITAATSGGVFVAAEASIPAHKLAIGMADALLRQGQVGEADRAVRLAARFAEFEQAAGAREEVKLREERERLTKWWAEKQTEYHKLHIATDMALSQIMQSSERDLKRMEDECCPKCARRMDFWPEEIELPDEDEPEFGRLAAAESGSGEFGPAESVESGSGEFRRTESGDESGREWMLTPRWPGD